MEHTDNTVIEMTDADKIKHYEDFLHRLNMFVVCCNSEGIQELVSNADSWSYAHRVGNGEMDEETTEKNIQRLTRSLSDTPSTDYNTKVRQKRYEEYKRGSGGS